MASRMLEKVKVSSSIQEGYLGFIKAGGLTSSLIQSLV